MAIKLPICRLYRYWCNLNLHIGNYGAMNQKKHLYAGVPLIGNALFYYEGCLRGYFKEACKQELLFVGFGKGYIWMRKNRKSLKIFLAIISF